MSVLVASQTLWPFVNTLAPYAKYSLGNKEILLQWVQFELSKKLNVFSQVFIEFVKNIFNFEHFEKKDELHSFCISEIIDGERGPYVSL